MADSVGFIPDRVFSHALNTVRKIPRTGSSRPPPEDRLRLYGLYKQSMEGDVDGVMARPAGDREDMRAERDKWDAWSQQKGMTRTEAKRRYISTLIDTMHKYAKSPDARELVSELEFVWDQIKSNVPSASSDSGIPNAPRPSASTQEKGFLVPQRPDAPLRMLSPGSQDDRSDVSGQHGEDDKVPNYIGMQIHNDAIRRQKELDDLSWRQRVEATLVKMTAEIAALREQLETRRSIQKTRKRRLRQWLYATLKVALKHFVWDIFLLWFLAALTRRNGDGRIGEAGHAILDLLKNSIGRVRTRRK